MSAQQNQFQQIKDQIALIRQTEAAGQWILTVQSQQTLSFQGQGSNGLQEFKHFLLPNIVAHIYYLMDKPQLPLLHSKYQCRALLITWIGEQADQSDAQVYKFIQQLSFQEAFYPIYASVVAKNAKQLQKAVDDLITGNCTHPSLKNTLEVIQNGFIIYNSKERKPTPRIITMVQQRSTTKTMLNGTIDAQAQIQNFLFGEKRFGAGSPKRQVQRQQLVRVNPKLSQEVQKFQFNMKNMQVSNSNVFSTPKKFEEPSDDLEDGDVDFIQKLIGSIQHPSRCMVSAQTKKSMSNKAKRAEPSVFLTQPDTPEIQEPPKQPPIIKEIKAAQPPPKKPEPKKDKPVEPPPSIVSPPKPKTPPPPQIQIQQPVAPPPPVKTQEQLEREKNLNKLKTQTSIINALTTRFSEKKVTKAQELLVDHIQSLILNQSEQHVKDVKQQLNKTAMAFLIIEAGKKGVMKKDFIQTLVAVQEYLPPNGDNILKRLIQGANAPITFEEVVAQVDLWVGFLSKHFNV